MPIPLRFIAYDQDPAFPVNPGEVWFVRVPDTNMFRLKISTQNLQWLHLDVPLPPSRIYVTVEADGSVVTDGQMADREVASVGRTGSTLLRSDFLKPLASDTLELTDPDNKFAAGEEILITFLD